jgi:ribosomal protein L19
MTSHLLSLKEEAVICDYFKSFHVKNLKKDYIVLRRNREKLKGFKKAFYFKVGDILEIVYMRGRLPLIFTGICICLKKRKMLNPDTGFILRNVIMGVGIEVTFSLFYNRVYKPIFVDFKRKFHNYRKNRLFFVRYRVSRNSKV